MRFVNRFFPLFIMSLIALNSTYSRAEGISILDLLEESDVDGSNELTNEDITLLADLGLTIGDDRVDNQTGEIEEDESDESYEGNKAPRFWQTFLQRELNVKAADAAFLLHGPPPSGGSFAQIPADPSPG